WELQHGPAQDTYSFGPADRGRIDRVDLVATPGVRESFAQWLARYHLPANSNPNSDPLRKGLTLQQQYISCADPTRKDSLFAFIGIQPAQVGITVTWSSALGRMYSVERKTNITDSFRVFQSTILASATVIGSPTPT